MARFGETDWRPIENLRRLLTDASETYLQTKQSQLAMDREMRRQAAINQILTSTAEAIRPKKVRGPLEPTGQPVIIPGAMGPATDIPVYPQAKQTVKEVPLESRERNRIIDEAALRVAGIPGGENVANFLYRYREPIDRLTPYQLASLGFRSEALDLAKKNAARMSAKDTAATGDIYVRDKKSGALVIRQDVSPSTIVSERNRVRDELDERRKRQRGNEAGIAMLESLKSSGDVEDTAFIESLKTQYIDAENPTQIKELEERFDALNRSGGSPGGGKNEKQKKATPLSE